MRPFFKIITALSVLGLASYTIGRLYNKATDGFRIGNIAFEKQHDNRWETPWDPSLAESALNQPYHYLGKGHQSFVFESQDGKYVIKFLKCHLVKTKPWIAWLPPLGFLNKWRARREAAKQRRLEGIFSGWKIAAESLPYQTGVIAAHMNVTDSFPKRLSVTNKAGWSYELDLDRTAFLLQHKVDMFVPTIEGYLSAGETGRAEKLLASLISMYQQLCSAGISDTDPQIMRNTGVSKGRPILIDVGRLKKDPRVKARPACTEEIKIKTKLLLGWLQRRHPELATNFQQQLEVLGDADG